MSSALRPMTTGEVLDRTFHLYRNNFVLFAGIACLTPALGLAVDFILLGLGSNPLKMSPAKDPLGYFLPLGVYLVGGVLSSAATVYAVSMVHLEKTTTILASYISIGRYLGRLLLLILLITLVMGGIALLVIIPAILSVRVPDAAALFGIVALLGSIVAVVLIVHFYARLSLSMAACVIEKVPPVQAMKRSFFLTRGASGGIWLIFLLTFVINVALGFVVATPLTLLFKNGQINELAYTVLLLCGQFLAGTLAGPILTVALALVYYDQRVRKEAFDLQFMMEALGQTPEQAAAAPIG